MGYHSPGAQYEHFLTFLDRILAEASSRGLTLRDRLDAQSIAWSITTHLPPDWSDSDRRALQAYRGDAVADELADIEHTDIVTDDEDETVLSFESMDPPTPTTWWVNQGGSYAQVRDGGYLWASLRYKNGLTPSTGDLERLRPGDIVLHYANSALRAVSQVQAAAVHSPRPAVNEADPKRPRWVSRRHRVSRVPGTPAARRHS